MGLRQHHVSPLSHFGAGWAPHHLPEVMKVDECRFDGILEYSANHLQFETTCENMKYVKIYYR